MCRIVIQFQVDELKHDWHIHITNFWTISWCPSRTWNYILFDPGPCSSYAVCCSRSRSAVDVKTDWHASDQPTVLCLQPLSWPQPRPRPLCLPLTIFRLLDPTTPAASGGPAAWRRSRDQPPPIRGQGERLPTNQDTEDGHVIRKTVNISESTAFLLLKGLILKLPGYHKTWWTQDLNINQ